MKNRKKWILPTVFTLLGAILGYLWSVKVGCGGSCLIMGTPWLAAAYLGVVGFLISMIIPRKEDV